MIFISTSYMYFDDDSFKKEQSDMETPVSHYKSMEHFWGLIDSLFPIRRSELAQIQTHPNFNGGSHYL